MNRSRHVIIDDDLHTICAANLPWRELEGSRFLVTGAAGMLPAYFVETLLYLNETSFRHPCHVVAMVRDISRAASRFEAYVGRGDLHLVANDVCEEADYGDFDHIVHAASPASSSSFYSDPVGTLCANTIGTYRLLEMARHRHGTSLLFFSSGEVYGTGSRRGNPIKEDMFEGLDPTEIRSCYGESKRMGEAMCSAWSCQYGVPTKIVRPFHTYGPGLKLGDGRAFSDFVANVLSSQNIMLKSDGGSARCYCYLADATVAFFTVLLKGENAEPYNVGSHYVLTVQELADLLISLVPEMELEVVREEAMAATGRHHEGHDDIRPDLTKISALGWHPTTTPEEGFLRTLRSFR